LEIENQKTEIRKAESRKQKSGKLKAEMKGRLSEEFRARTKLFAARSIRLYVKLPKDREEVRVCGKQMLRAGTSVAAHTREASRARSDAEFISKLGGSLQEADETQMWLELLREECGIDPDVTKPLEKEADELMAIMTTMINRTKDKN
jgi:four helix bundle protein